MSSDTPKPSASMNAIHEPSRPWVLVTGASSGVGFATVLALLKVGYSVWALASRDLQLWETQLRQEFPQAGDALLCSQVDLSSEAARLRWIAEFEAWPHQNQLRTMIHNAGIGELGSVEDTPLDAARRLWEVNYWAVVELSRAVLPHWRAQGGGRLILLGSVVTELHFPFKAQYSASKAAITAWAESLHQECSRWGLELCILEPGWIRSEFHARLPILGAEGYYGRFLKPFQNYARDSDSKYPTGAQVADIILQQIRSPKMALRLAVGPDAKAYFRFLWWLKGRPRAQFVSFLSKA
jgi:short-subunit dehydrogenase